MRNRLLLVGFVLMAVTMFAQIPVPGTFTTMPVQQIQPGTPILGTPIATLGNGLTPTVVTNSQILVVGAPQYAPIPTVESEIAANTIATGTVVENAPEGAPRQGGAQITVGQVKYFDFVVADSGSAYTSSEGRSLGEVARATRKGSTPAFAGRTITNDDVNRMNQRYPSGTVPSPQQSPQP